MFNNAQVISPRLHSETGDLELHHAFPTIQGEGPFAGTPAVFVRLYGCNLQCPGCDTDYTSQREPMSPATLVRLCQELTPATMRRKRLVVITGGEPFRQNIGPAVLGLARAGFLVQIETNGTCYNQHFPHEMCTIVCSPKTGRIDRVLEPHIAAFKYVVEAGKIDPKDGLPTNTLGNHGQTFVARPLYPTKVKIYVQPLDVGDPVANAANTQAAITSCLKFGYILCIQTHKLCNLE